MCGSSSTRVRGVKAAAKRSTSACGDVMGTGKLTSRSTIPSRFTRCRHALSMRP